MPWLNVSRYDEIRDIQINHLASARFGVNEETTNNLCDAIDEKVDAYAMGDLKHAAEIVPLLWGAAKNRRGSTPAPTPQTAGTSVRPAADSIHPLIGTSEPEPRKLGTREKSIYQVDPRWDSVGSEILDAMFKSGESPTARTSLEHRGWEEYATHRRT